MDEEGWFVLHKGEIWLTTCTHSMRGSLTAMFPDKLTTHAGVSGVASSRAITASTPILLAWIMTVKKQELGKAGTLVFIHIVTRNKTHFCRWGSGCNTRILSKAEGVPPLWTWPKMVVRVSKPSFFDTSWTEIVILWAVCLPWRAYMCRYIGASLPLLTCLICSHVIGLPLQSIAPSAIMIIFKREPRPLCWEGQRKHQQPFFWSQIQISPWRRCMTRQLHLTVFCTDVPPIPHLGASLGWTPSQHHRPERSPKPGTCQWRVIS